MLPPGVSIVLTAEEQVNEKRELLPELRHDESLSSDEDMTSPNGETLSSPTSASTKQRRKLFNDERWSATLVRCISPRKSTTGNVTTGSLPTRSPINEGTKTERRRDNGEPIQTNQLISWDMEEPQSAKTCEGPKIRASLFMRRAIKPVPFLDDDHSSDIDGKKKNGQFCNTPPSQTIETDSRRKRHSRSLCETTDRRHFGILRVPPASREPLTICVDHKPSGVRRRMPAAILKQTLPSFVDGMDSSVDQGSATSSELTDASLVEASREPDSVAPIRLTVSSASVSFWVHCYQATQFVYHARVATKVWIALLDILLFAASIIFSLLSTVVTVVLWGSEKAMLWLCNQPVFRYVVVVLVRLTTRKKAEVVALPTPDDESFLEDDSARCAIYHAKRMTLWQKLKAKRARKEHD